MHFITAIGSRWKRVAGASLTIALLSAVAVVGLILFGSEVFAAWKAPSNGEQTFASSGPLKGLLNFEAPTATVAQFAAATEESDDRIRKTSSGSLLVSNWISTDTSSINPIQLYLEGFQIQILTALVERLFPNTALAAFVLSFEQAWLTLANGYLVNVLHLPPIPIASPVS